MTGVYGNSIITKITAREREGVGANRVTTISPVTVSRTNASGERMFFRSRFGYDSAVWCQRYELFCDEKERRRKATELITIMEAAVKIHYKCEQFVRIRFLDTYLSD
uniref:Transposase n=1 Tax=Angiostrongylus cantonensis TaxID=6313 RepID=A0A0K0DBZ8_ANGCA